MAERTALRCQVRRGQQHDVDHRDHADRNNDDDRDHADRPAPMTPRTAPLLLALALACTPPPQDPAPAHRRAVAPPPPQPPVVRHRHRRVRRPHVHRGRALAHRAARAGARRRAGAHPHAERVAQRPRRAHADLPPDHRPHVRPAGRPGRRPGRPAQSCPTTPSRSSAPGHDPHTAVMFTLQSATLPADQLSGIADAIRDALLTVPDVTDVALCGRRTAEIEVTLDLPRLTALGVSARRGPRGSARRPPAMSLRSSAHASTRAASRTSVTIALAARDPPVRLRDVATVRRNSPIDTCDAIRLGGEPVLLGVVHARRGVPLDDFKKAVQRPARRPARPLARATTIGLATPELAPLRIAVDLEATGDPASALADNAARLEKLLQAADLQVRAYLQAPVPALHGERYTGDLFVLPTSDDEAARPAPRASRSSSRPSARSAASPTRRTTRSATPRGSAGPASTRIARSPPASSAACTTCPASNARAPHDILNPELVLEIDRDMLGAVGLRQQRHPARAGHRPRRRRGRHAARGPRRHAGGRPPARRVRPEPSRTASPSCRR
jgi:hypothetical protein